MAKLSKHPHYHDPLAFAKARNFAKIVKREAPHHPMQVLQSGKTEFYSMGKLGIILDILENGYFLSIQGKDTYPSWDEIVWIRYNLIPDAARMALVLPNLNSYINNEDDNYKFVFTMEQTGWALDPIPTCRICQTQISFVRWHYGEMEFECENCKNSTYINPHTYNEEHGNGFLAKRLQAIASEE